MMISQPQRDIRQRGLIPPERLANLQAVVIGVGAIGRQVAIQLACIGIPRLVLFDHDTVGPENLAVQGYWPEDLGHLKVEATARLCRRILPELEVTDVAQRFRRQDAVGLSGNVVVFACVDSITTRRILWESLRDRVRLFLDGRMHGEVMRVLAWQEGADTVPYGSTLFSEQEAHAGSCTTRSTIYTASIAAGFMLAQLARWTRGLLVLPDQTLQLLSGELITAGDVP